MNITAENLHKITKATPILIADFIKPSESCELTAYLCPTRHLTIGWGHTGSDVYPGQVWTQPKADAMLLADTAARLMQAIHASPILGSMESTVGQLVAIADFIYNFGYGKYINSDLKPLVDQGAWEDASIEILLWCKGRVGGRLVTMPGLVKRRRLESDLLWPTAK